MSNRCHTKHSLQTCYPRTANLLLRHSWTNSAPSDCAETGENHMNTIAEQIRQRREALLHEAQSLAGALHNLPQRAATYHHLYQDSQGNHIFPLIAAHGALWAKGYFRFGLKLGEILAWQDCFDPLRRAEKMATLNAFVDAFREINKIVCVDSYTNYYLVKEFGEISELLEWISPELLTALGRVHRARTTGQPLSDQEKRAVFRTHFLHEQTHVVGPRVQEAVEKIDWPLLKFIALRPWVHFSYFPRLRAFWFRNFCNQEERIQRGLAAFDIAIQLGWEQVEQRLTEYHSLPEQFFSDPVTHFAMLKQSILQSSAAA